MNPGHLENLLESIEFIPTHGGGVGGRGCKSLWDVTPPLFFAGLTRGHLSDIPGVSGLSLCSRERPCRSPVLHLTKSVK